MELTQITKNLVNSPLFEKIDNEGADLIISSVLLAYREGRADEKELAIEERCRKTEEDNEDELVDEEDCEDDFEADDDFDDDDEDDE